MKIQDILFLILCAVLCYKRNSRIAVIMGLTCLLVSIPLFALRIFFTAERLAWYGSAFFFLAIIFIIREVKKGNA